ncbi:hypothetical protein RHMOL_Rhmol04G0360800 [Rhododendron molle]|uniref:Uncharacterized protein n=1 Tax=Rhododendron molle TaxID=49168 RepID=A0ACC0P9H9_RHOML|nr:hypothetical protein RHMOL_Rhmol04G0360800 [Rhododendron molle]
MWQNTPLDLVKRSVPLGKHVVSLRRILKLFLTSRLKQMEAITCSLMGLGKFQNPPQRHYMLL